MNVVGPVWASRSWPTAPGDSALDHTPHEHIDLDAYHRAIAVLTRVLSTLVPNVDASRSIQTLAAQRIIGISSSAIQRFKDSMTTPTTYHRRRRTHGIFAAPDYRDTACASPSSIRPRHRSAQVPHPRGQAPNTAASPAPSSTAGGRRRFLRRQIDLSSM